MSFYSPEIVECNGSKFKQFIPREEIDDRVSELGKQISEDFKDKNPIFIGVLNGAFIFLADLMRHITIPCEVDFLKLSSYGDEKVSSGNVTEQKHISAQIVGRHVILVEDIVDTGLSMNYLVSKLNVDKPASITVVTLLHKPNATKHDVQIDYVGFKIPTLFVLGYGLDYAQIGRNLANIYVIEEESGK